MQLFSSHHPNGYNLNCRITHFPNSLAGLDFERFFFSLFFEFLSFFFKMMQVICGRCDLATLDEQCFRGLSNLSMLEFWSISGSSAHEKLSRWNPHGWASGPPNHLNAAKITPNHYSYAICCWCYIFRCYLFIYLFIHWVKRLFNAMTLSKLLYYNISFYRFTRCCIFGDLQEPLWINKCIQNPNIGANESHWVKHISSVSHNVQ